MKNWIVVIVSLFALSVVGCAHHGKKKGCDHKKGDKSHHAKIWEKMDANNDGAVSKDEYNKSHADMFVKMDANKDGKVTKEEKMAFKKSKKKDCCK